MLTQNEKEKIIDNKFTGYKKSIIEIKNDSKFHNVFNEMDAAVLRNIDDEIKDKLLEFIAFKFKDSVKKYNDILNCIYSTFNNIDDIHSFYYFITNAKFEIPNQGNIIIDFDKIIDYYCDKYKILNPEIIYKFYKLFNKIAKINDDKIGKYEMVLILFFSNITNADKEDILIDNIPFEIKSGSYAVKSNGARSGKIDEIVFLESLDLYGIYKSKIITPDGRNLGIFSSTPKLIEFNNYLLTCENVINRNKLIQATKDLVYSRCGNNEGLDEILDRGIIIEKDNRYVFNTRPTYNGKYNKANNHKVKSENCIEKILFCCDLYNLVKNGHNNMLIFQDSRLEIPKGLYLDFNKEHKTFKDIFDSISINNENDFYFQIDTLWYYQLEEKSNVQEQALVSSISLKIK